MPSRAPINVSTSPINSTSFSVTWQPVPLDYVNGIVRGYKISLENMDDSEQVSAETVHINQTMIVLRESKAASRFCVRLLAFTSKGDGKRSDCIEGWTWSKGTRLHTKLLVVNFKFCIKHEKPCLTTCPNPEKRDEITTRSRVFLMSFDI